MRTARFAAAALLLPVAAALTACGGAADPAPARSAERTPQQVLVAAAEVMKRAGGAEVELRGGELRWAGPVVWAPKPAMELARSDGRRLKVVDGAAYAGGPGVAEISRGKAWQRLDGPVEGLKDLRAGRVDPLGLGTVLMLREQLDPAAGLALAAKEEAVTRVGAEQLDGAAATHYRVEAPGGLYLGDPALSQDNRRTLAEQLQRARVARVVIDYWVNDRDELLKRTESGNGAAGAATAEIRYRGLGVRADVSAPPPGDVAGLMDLLPTAVPATTPATEES
ncbi:hypothetical protein [Kitasatospora sp. NPDC002040]|uniref:hypothetical protein n=1 Tax=Kitasatospora sp. NPDC002040 TaxID=3154661 RepID=UPI00332A58AE